jgi:hypothetical protein
MDTNFKERQQKSWKRTRCIRDIVMALSILSVGVLVFFSDTLGLNLELDETMRYLFSGLCLLYGSFRLYRGLKENE